jgi:hypothetical protein
MLQLLLFFREFSLKNKQIIIQNKNKLKTKWKRNSLKELAQEAKNGLLRFRITLESVLNC